MVQSLASLSGYCCRLQCRSQRQLRLVLPWLWYRPAAVAPIQTLAWEVPYATSAAIKKKRGKKKKKRKGNYYQNLVLSLFFPSTLCGVLTSHQILKGGPMIARIFSFCAEVEVKGNWGTVVRPKCLGWRRLESGLL